ncbi:hypothetical protein BaRGS_00028394 [Batillaria attramentaria]|uniref:Uncharacterized protein n=1 Tax=Batillaria attramentaria TaxID=370345 RepID=A0ABD0K072_9CAEN
MKMGNNCARISHRRFLYIREACTEFGRNISRNPPHDTETSPAAHHKTQKHLPQPTTRHRNISRNPPQDTETSPATHHKTQKHLPQPTTRHNLCTQDVIKRALLRFVCHISTENRKI